MLCSRCYFLAGVRPSEFPALRTSDHADLPPPLRPRLDREEAPRASPSDASSPFRDCNIFHFVFHPAFFRVPLIVFSPPCLFFFACVQAVVSKERLKEDF